MTTDDTLTTDAILDAFATAATKRVLPHAALEQARDRWSEVGPALLALFLAEANGTDRSDRSDAILFFAIYLMAQRHETQAFHPLCTIAANGDRMYDLIGDGLTEDLPGILTRVYDGDPAPLRRLIESPDADEFARAGGLDALARLTAIGRIGRDETTRYLRDLHATLQPQDQSFVWVGWQQAVARAGLDDLAPLVEDAFRREWIDPDIMDVHHFQNDLSAAKQGTGPANVFNERDNRLDDIVSYLSGWDSFRPEPHRPPRPIATPVNSTTIHNPYRDVGRNDPCPCGSGKKFKKCCLDKVR